MWGLTPPLHPLQCPSQVIGCFPIPNSRWQAALISTTHLHGNRYSLLFLEHENSAFFPLISDGSRKPEPRRLVFSLASLKICSAVTSVTLEILHYSLTRSVVLGGLFTSLHPCVQRQISDVKQLEQDVGARAVRTGVRLTPAACLSGPRIKACPCPVDSC